MIITEERIQELTTCTQMFMNHVHWVQQSFNLLPDRQHYGTCINYVDQQEYRAEFCQELVNTIPEWVYSQQKASAVLDQLIAEGRSNTNAQTALISNTFSKFRNRDGRDLFTQGQFGELLLFNFLQSFFKAVPLLRKMPISTSAEMERFGVDAIHYSSKDGKHLLYLGEAKTYSSKYQFNSALKDAIESILKTNNNFRKELGLYVYDSFIDDSLLEIASAYKNGTLQNVEIHLVSIVTYCENKTFDRKNESQIKQDIIKIIEDRGKAVERDCFSIIETGLHPRFNYILLPVWELDKLIEEFQRLIGK
jgi:hypothetical protein